MLELYNVIMLQVLLNDGFLKAKLLLTLSHFLQISHFDDHLSLFFQVHKEIAASLSSTTDFLDQLVVLSDLSVLKRLL